MIMMASWELSKRRRNFSSLSLSAVSASRRSSFSFTSPNARCIAEGSLASLSFKT